jgi:hypothetical protein
MSSTQQHVKEEETAFERVEQAFTRLQAAWQAVHHRLMLAGHGQITTEIIRELDAAEEEWLAAREPIAFETPTVR